MYKPMLAPNEEVDIKVLNYPLLASFKIDGIRAIFREGKMLSRALKTFPNLALAKQFAILTTYAEKNKLTLDGELYCKSRTFNELSGDLRRIDGNLPNDLCFYCFDYVKNDKFNVGFHDRATALMVDDELCLPAYHLNKLAQKKVHNAEEVKEFYEKALAWGCDGLILRSINGRYKFGRGTVKEGLIYKVKPYKNFDAKIIGFVQATEVDPDAEKKVNELGRSVTSKKLGDRNLVEKLAAFVVMYEGLELKVMAAMTDEEKIEVWKNQKKYLGKFIEYKGMLVGAKDLPRHPTFLRWRTDKD